MHVLGVADFVDAVAVGGDVGIGGADLDLGGAAQLDGDGLAGDAIGQALVCGVDQRDRLLFDLDAVERGLHGDGHDLDRDVGVVGRVAGVGVGVLAAHQGREESDEHERVGAEHVASLGAGGGAPEVARLRCGLTECDLHRNFRRD